MGVLSGLAKVAVGSAAVMYFIGREGAKTGARFAGGVVGQTIAGMRRSRGEMQAKLTQDETPEQLAAARRMQKGWWEVRMIMNEFSMLRSFNPRLLQAGNFGFTDEEMLAAIGRRPSDFDESEASRVAHIERQLDMERQQLENPRMWPVAGHHGSENDAAAYMAATSSPALAGRGPGDDPLRKQPAPSAAETAPGVVEVTASDGTRSFRAGVTRQLSSMESELHSMHRSEAPVAASVTSLERAPQPVQSSLDERAALSSAMMETFQDLRILRRMAVEQQAQGER